MKLEAPRLTFGSLLEAIEGLMESGMTDGLPVIPPTPELVRAMLDAVHLRGEEILGELPERQRVVTAEKVAINAVMAGCRPDYMPVVVAAVKAVLAPDFGLHGANASTGGAGVLLVVNGPIATRIGIESGRDVLTCQTRAAATIGRAVHLVIRNVLGGREMDQSTLGHPGRRTFCIAEREDTVWGPLHLERGFSREESVVTAFATESPNQINNHVAQSGEGILRSIADRIAAGGRLHWQRQLPQTPCVVVISPEHYHRLSLEGWSKAQVKRFLYETATRPVRALAQRGQWPSQVLSEAESEMHFLPSPDEVYLLVAGGEAGGFRPWCRVGVTSVSPVL